MKNVNETKIKKMLMGDERFHLVAFIFKEDLMLRIILLTIIFSRKKHKTSNSKRGK
jgi:hypothetical protein